MPPDLDLLSMSPRRLTEADAPQGHRLSAEAGWNQTEDDWNLMIRMGQGIGFVDQTDELIATTILIPYRSGADWLSMVLVDKDHRGQGIGSRLVRLVVELSLSSILGLDATEMGQSIYRDLGFNPSDTITRFRRPRQTRDDVAERRQASIITRTEFQDRLVEFVSDGEPARIELLGMLDPGDQGRCCLVRGEKTVALGSVRRGQTASQIGPLFATDAASAIALLQWIMAQRGESLIIDVPERNEAFVSRLSKLGFKPSRAFTRMFRGGMPRPNSREYAIAGPEYG